MTTTTTTTAAMVTALDNEVCGESAGDRVALAQKVGCAVECGLRSAWHGLYPRACRRPLPALSPSTPRCSLKDSHRFQKGTPRVSTIVRYTANDTRRYPALTSYAVSMVAAETLPDKLREWTFGLVKRGMRKLYIA